MNENDIRKKICAYGKSLFERGLSGGSSGNISARVTDGWLMTPTGISIGALNPAALSKLDEHGKHVSGLKPTKEKFLHLTMYQERPTAGAVVHLHSTYTVAVSCLVNVNPEDVLPPITAYFVMRIGRLPLVPYYRPGDPATRRCNSRSSP